MKTVLDQTFLIFLGLLLPCISFSQEAVASTSIFDYLTQKEGAQLVLELDLEQLDQNRKNADYIPAVLTDESGRTFSLEVRTRGKFRRRKCDIPPIKLKFPKDSLHAEQMNAMNEIKLVLPCAERAEYDELIIREYVAYRMYELLSPDYCTRARLIRLHLKHTGKKRPKKMFGLLVEHEEQVSSRMSSSASQQWGVKPDQLNTDQAALVALFQFMIGNTDWEIASCRNIMLLQPPDSSAKLVPVPYDFDFSGLVSAPYASPSVESGMPTVLDRYLMANGIRSEAIENARKRILDAKGELYTWCSNSFLSRASSEQMVFFLDVFFKTIEADSEIPEKLQFPRE